MDCSLPGSSIHGIFQARILEWGAIAFSKGEEGRADWCGVILIVGITYLQNRNDIENKLMVTTGEGGGGVN